MKKWLLITLFSLTTIITHAEPLKASEVFQLNIKKIDPNTFVLNWQIKSGYFLYKNRIHLNTEQRNNIHLGTLRFPKAENKKDKQGRVFAIYHNELSIPVGILGQTPGETTLRLSYQGCSGEGFCYPPEKKQIKLTINNHLALHSVSIEEDSSYTPRSQPSSTDQITQIFTQHNWPMILILFYGFGLLLSFTPCILPMVPVLSGIIVGHGKEITTKKAFFLSLCYVLSMSVTYAIAGAMIALLGANIQINLQSPPAIILFSLIFIALALSMFGFYEFRLPESWQEKIAGNSRKQRGGHYTGVIIMGCLSTLILSPCVTAPLIGVLTYIAQSGHVLSGSLTLFILSMGMGTPLLLIGTSAGKWLPGAGYWMNAVKAFFGVLFIAIAIYLLDRILPKPVIMGLWSTLLIFSGIYTGALTYSATHLEKFFQGTGLILLGYGLLILIGTSMGETHPLQPLGSLRADPSNATTINPINKQTVSTIEKTIQNAQGKPIMLDFYADWCASCKIMEATTFKDPNIQSILNQFKVIKIDVTANNAHSKEIMTHFHVIAPPTFIFFNSQGKELNDQRIVGETRVKTFLDVLHQVSKK